MYVCVCEETLQLLLFLLVEFARTSHYIESSKEDLSWQQVPRLGTGQQVQQDFPDLTDKSPRVVVVELGQALAGTIDKPPQWNLYKLLVILVSTITIGWFMCSGCLCRWHSL